MRKYIFLLLIVCPVLSKAQCLIPSGPTDTSYPVTNNIKEHSSYNMGAAYENPKVFSTINHNNRKIILGDFKYLVKQRGAGLILDSNSRQVITSSKWQVHGVVNSSVPDGNGGFYIAGDFERIGDSLRKNIAHINSSGQPTTTVLPATDGPVNVIIRRNDTLFIGGYFEKLGNISRYNFAMYRLSSKQILPNGGGAPFSASVLIYSMVLNKDTIIASGPNMGLRKFSFKNNAVVPMTNPVNLEIKNLVLSTDGTVVIICPVNNEFIRGVSNYSGNTVYNIPLIGEAVSVDVSGNKAYAVGFFSRATTTTTTIFQKGFFAFNPNTGAHIVGDLNLNGFASFVKADGDKVYVSGHFTKSDTATRDNFLLFNSVTMSLDPWNLAPSDPVKTLSFSNARIFAGGNFNGVHATRRNGWAAIDMVTNEILPWQAAPHEFEQCKRMVAIGDTLFVLGVMSTVGTCIAGDFFAELKCYDLNTGAIVPKPTGLGFYGRMNDFLVDGNFFYAAIDQSLRRFPIGSFVHQPWWGGQINGGAVIQILADQNNI